ncbi:MAG: BREX-4 system phosphatase PglZ [Selenomonadaceae bacterium]|nr:BREX-4 system phosphatase PglZ [Selenomonadaceae bacterium]
MIAFDSLDELKKFLRDDKDRKTFSPVRFINVDSLHDWIQIKNFSDTLATNFIFLSDYCAEEDTFPNLRKLRSDLQKESRNICVLPLSEFLRLNPDLVAREINLLLNLRKDEVCSFRFYFPMYRMKNFFGSLKISDSRQKNCVLLLSSKETDDYSLTVIQKSMRFKISGECVDGFKQYLSYWENYPNTSLTLYTENAVYLQDKKFFDNVKVIANAFDLLRQNHNLPAEFKRNFGREEDWQKMVELVATVGNFEQVFRGEFKLDGFGISAFKNFGVLENFRQWLLWLWCMLQGSDYLSRCAKASTSPKEFMNQIYEMIFSCVDEKNFNSLCDERREILSLTKTFPPETFPEQIRQADKRLALKILTNTSHVEQLLIFETLQRFGFKELSAVRKILKVTFPQLANYLAEGAESLGDNQAKYFNHYRWLKVTNRLTADFNRYVTDIAENAGRNIYALKSRNEIVNEEYSDKAAVFFVDGLGAEYMNFFVTDFASLEENFSIKYQIGRCNLPSVTEHNKDFLSGKNVAEEILTLDTIKHEDRNYPENILGELQFLSTLKEKILHALNLYEKIILCSDHGTSRLAVLARKTEFDTAFCAENRKVYKSGRFAEALPNDTVNFPTALEYDNKTIFADYSRFTQKGAPGNEIHGGATLEEILVPVITIERRKKIPNQKILSSVKKVKRGINKNADFDI